MTSSNWNIFRVTAGEFPSQRPVTWSFDVFFDLRLNKRLSKYRKADDVRRHRAHYDVTVMLNYKSKGVQIHVTPVWANCLPLLRLIILLANRTAEVALVEYPTLCYLSSESTGYRICFCGYWLYFGTAAKFINHAFVYQIIYILTLRQNDSHFVDGV